MTNTVEVLFVDASGSTQCNKEYWLTVRTLHDSRDYNDLYTWDHTSRRSDVSKLMGAYAMGSATQPVHIMKRLKDDVLQQHNKTNAYINLYITTDGLIYENEIRQCFNTEYDVVRCAILSVNIYYIGDEKNMNFGLNMVFGDSPKLAYYVNTIDTPMLVSTIEALIEQFTTPEDNEHAVLDKSDTVNYLLDPQLKVAMITRLGYLNSNDNIDYEKQLLRLRKVIISAFNRAKERETSDSKLKMKQAFMDGNAEFYVKTLKNQLYNTDSINTKLEQRKCELLSCFDKHNRMFYEKIDRFVESKAVKDDLRDITCENNNDDNIIWANINDDITLDKLNDLPCMPVRVASANVSIQLNAEELRHPLAVLANKEKRDLFAQTFIEPYILNYNTIEQIGVERLSNAVGGNGREVFTSPYTRQICYPLIVAPRTLTHLRYNTSAVSRLFDRKNDCALPGGDNTTLVLWNFVILWCAYERLNTYQVTHRNSGNHGSGEANDDENDDKAHVLWQELQRFCDNFNCSRFLSIKTSLSHESVSLREALWFVCWAIPQHAPNSAAFNQFLRRSFGYAIFDAYVKLFNANDNKTSEILKSVKIWHVWSYMIDLINANKQNVRTLEYRVRAQWQEWLEWPEHGKELILLSGSCTKPYPCASLNLLADVVPPKVLWHIFELCKQGNLSRFYDLSSIIRDATINTTDDHHYYQAIVNECDENLDIARSTDIAENHMSINSSTGHPYVICPKTGLHWRECLGTSRSCNVQPERGSWYRLFNRFCNKYDRYPRNHLDLVQYLSKRYYQQQQKQNDKKYDYVIDVRILPIFEKIFKQFNDSIISRMTVKEYQRLYLSFCTNDGEQKRLELERSNK